MSGGDYVRGGFYPTPEQITEETDGMKSPCLHLLKSRLTLAIFVWGWAVNTFAFPGA